MAVKKYQDRLHISVPEKKMTFRQCERGFNASFEQEMLQENLPLTTGVLTGDEGLLKALGNALPEATAAALQDTQFVNVFGRVVKHDSRKDMTCLQYLYVWDYQAVPAHEADYEPVFVYVQGDRRHAIYDLVHYCSRRIDLGRPGVDGPGLQMVPGWHSFLPASKLTVDSADKDLQVMPLSDQHLDAWWSIPDEEPRLKIKKFLLDPFAMEAPGHFMERPDENAKTMCCTFLEIEKAMQEFDDPRTAMVEGVKRAMSKCIGFLAFHRIGAFLQLLGEMNDVGMINIPVSMRRGLDFTAIGRLLSDGLVSLTKIGKSWFERTKHGPQDDDDSSGSSVKDSIV